MKGKTSVTLSRELLDQIDRSIGDNRSRSAFIERVLRLYFRQRERREQQARDLELLNRAADRLNAEAFDVLDYQAPLD